MTNTPPTLLVALDASPAARGVLAQAAALAQTLGGRLVLFRAIRLPTELPVETLLVPEEQLMRQLKANALRDLEMAAQQVPVGLVAGMRVGFGVPWEAICQAAREDDVALIAIGSHGYSLFERVLGTTAARVVNHADRAVLVLRPGTGPSPVGAG